MASTTGRARVVLAACIVSAGLLCLTPSLNFDSDRDGVADSVEIYELGTDPASPGTFGRRVVAGSPRLGGMKQN